MEIQDFMDQLRGQLAAGIFDISEDIFFSAMLLNADSFINHEGDLWDFKETWPFSYSDSYFQSLLKLVVSFANNMGGMIIFNVKDEGKVYKKSKVLSNPDRFMTACHDNISQNPNIEYREFCRDGKIVPVLIVFPKACDELPAALKQWKGKKKKHWFVREGYECVSASAKKIPMIFCRPQVRSKEIDIAPSEVALPPSPSNLKHFVTRFEILEKVFEWLHDELQPRCFLYGRGGSGKTTIAYEVARYVGKYNLTIDKEKLFDLVIFVSAKEKELNVYSARQVEYLGTDFTSTRELYQAILTLSGYYTRVIDEVMSIKELTHDLRDLFDNFNSLIVIDDIDTITTKGDDAGLEELLLMTARAKAIPKLLYTMRNAPSYAISNSIEVPGLTDKDEIEAFVLECAKQFKVSPPSLEDLNTILRITEGRPLGIESLIALRRSTRNYTAAIKSFEEHAGDNARSYVFEREWSALPENQRSHNLLVALAIAARPLSADELQTILRYDEHSVQESIVETMEMFLELEEGPSGTTYALGEMTKQFVISRAPSLRLYDQIKARVKTFKSRFHHTTPELRKLMIEAEKLIYQAGRDNDQLKYNQAWNIVVDLSLPEKIKQNPIFMVFAGRLALSLPKAKLVEAREYLFDAHKNDHPIDIEVIEKWHRSECEMASGDDLCCQIWERVLAGRGYRESDRVRISLLEGARLYRRGKETRFHDAERALDFLFRSLVIHLENFYRAEKCGHLDLDRVEQYARNTALLLFLEIARLGDVVNFAEKVNKISAIEKIYLDPLLQPFVEYGQQVIGSAKSKKTHGLAVSALNKFSAKLRKNESWYDQSSSDELISIVDDMIAQSRHTRT